MSEKNLPDIEITKDKEMVVTKKTELWEHATAMCRHVSMGGSATDYCRDLKIDYYEITQLINQSPIHKDMWRTAKEAREEWTRERINEEIMALAMVNIGDAYDSLGEPLPFDELPDSIKKAINMIDKSVRYDKEGCATTTTKLKFTDKLKALEMLGKNNGMFVQKHQVDTKITLESLIGASFKDDKKHEQET